MKQVLMFSMIPFVSLSLFKCQATKSPDQYTPSQIVAKMSGYGTIIIKGVEYTGITNNELETIEAVINEGEYTSVDSINSTSSNIFTYSLTDHPLMWGHRHYEITFYADGYAKTGPVDIKDDNGKVINTAYYCYTFEPERAKRLYNLVNDGFEAYLAQEKEKEHEKETAKAKLQGFSIDEIIDRAKESETISVIYGKNYSSYQMGEGAFKDLICNATYTPCDIKSNSSTLPRDFIEFRIGLLNEDNKLSTVYYYTLYESLYAVRIFKRVYDKFDRTYDSELSYSVDRQSVHDIFDFVVENFDEGYDINSGN